MTIPDPSVNLHLNKKPMKKEVFAAVTIGFVLGLLITFGIWTANKSLKQSPPKLTGDIITPSPVSAVGTSTPTPSSPQTESGPILTVTAPVDEQLSPASTVTVTGTTGSKMTVVITAEDNQQIVAADSTGVFSAIVPLEGGYNLVTVTAVDASGKQTSRELTIGYTTAKL